MRAFFLLVVMGCGSSQSHEAPLREATPAEVPEPAAPSEPVSEPDGEPMDSANPPEDGPVIAFAIDGESVDEETFNALFDRLDVDQRAYEGESVVQPDGSYGGAGQSFHARDGDVSYRYEHHTHPRDDGREGVSRLLFRE